MSDQKKILHDDRNGLGYVLVGDYYLPMIDLPEETRPIGYWGMLRKDYMDRPAEANLRQKRVYRQRR